MTRPVPPQARAIVQRFEQCRLLCFATDGSGTPTIGWGHTRGLTRADVGERVITQAQADALLDADLAVAAQTLTTKIGDDAIAAMTENQYSAMVSFVYNEGDFGPTLAGILRARRFDSVCPELARYVYAHVDGVATKLTGLVRRRNAEIELWSTDEPGSSDATPPSGVLQTVRTPPAPVAPAAHAPALVASAACAPLLALVIAAPGALAQASSLLQGVVDHTAGIGNTHVEHLRTVLVTVLGLLSAITPLALWAQSLAQRRESDGAPSGVAQPVASQIELPLQ